jgi:2'-5' RNA ligase
MSDSEQKSALLVPIPTADPLVSQWRRELDPAAKRGIPAHITVLFPFAPPTSLNDSMFERLHAVITTSRQFAFSFSSLEWFDTRVVYLAPTPDSGFRLLSQALQTAFPDYLPYGGKYEDPVPHLTIGDGAPFERLTEAAAAIQRALPITTRATEVWLMVGGMEPDSWSLRQSFELTTRSYV